MSTTETVVSWAVGILSSGAAGKFVYDFVTGRSKSRKEGAQGAAILVGSASDYARQLTEDIRELRAEFNTYRAEQDKRTRDQERLLRAHSRWDEQVQRQLTHLTGEDPGSPPPLFTDA